MSGIELIAAERQRQITQVAWSAEHDDLHQHDELLKAAICYAMFEVNDRAYADGALEEWPFDLSWFKTKGGEIRNLTKAGALIAAEIDRRLRINK